jgi:hypothetical protein
MNIGGLEMSSVNRIEDGIRDKYRKKLKSGRRNK